MANPEGAKAREPYQNFDEGRSLPVINYTLPYREGLGLGGCLLIRSLRQRMNNKIFASFFNQKRKNKIIGSFLK